MASMIFIEGLAIGFSIAAPVGPIGVLCIRRSLASGRAIGFATGLGAATADAAYGGVAGFGLTAVSGFLASQQFWLSLVGGLFLCYLGVRTFRSKPASTTVAAGGERWMTAYLSTLFLTLTNPMTLFSFAVIFAGFGLVKSLDYAKAALLVAGVFIGSALWWLILSSGTGLLRSRVTQSWMQIVNRVFGAVIAAFGIAALARLLVR